MLLVSLDISVPDLEGISDVISGDSVMTAPVSSLLFVSYSMFVTHFILPISVFFFPESTTLTGLS